MVDTPRQSLILQRRKGRREGRNNLTGVRDKSKEAGVLYSIVFYYHTLTHYSVLLHTQYYMYTVPYVLCDVYTVAYILYSVYTVAILYSVYTVMNYICRDWSKDIPGYSDMVCLTCTVISTPLTLYVLLAILI